ncbi:unnamed protein product [Periconia digitata]|uniref:Integral membrane protein n=1 Tax=Periconia digitata TaxID=1303443 RepID=A0A9W4XME3_9PLEO|nr:unnamed protein product [Periconia digitata]
MKQPYTLLISSQPKPDVKQALRLTTYFLLLFTIIALIVRNKCYADPTSYFFRPSIAYAAPHSSHRIDQADRYAESFTQLRTTSTDIKPATVSSSPSTTLCVGISSVRRPRLSYLKTTLSSMQDGLDGNDRKNLYFVVLLAHTNQSVHPDFGAPWLRGMADKLLTYGSENDTTYDVAKEMEESGGHEVKSKFDYSLVMSECLKSHSDYVLMVEDDVVFTSTWWTKTKDALSTVKTQTEQMGYENFYYLRLFYYESIQGWNAESWPRYLLLSAGIAATVFFALLAFQSHKLMRSFRLHTLSILLVTFVFTPAVISLYFSAGAVCMLPNPQGVQLMPEYACCGQALVFPRATVQDDVLPLFHQNEWNKTPVDSLIEKYADGMSGEIGDMRWAITPVLLQHVGSQSSHGVARDSGYGNMTPYKLWNFGFERVD